jgi:hypothetical protein
MHRKSLFILTVCTLAVSARAGSLVHRDVDASAAWVAHADIENLRGTAFGRHLLEKMQEPEAAQKLAAFEALWRFDPREDIASLTLYGWGQKKEGDGVLVVRGRLDREHLTTVVGGGEGYETRTHGNHLLHSWLDKKTEDGDEITKRKYGVFHTSGVLVLGEDADGMNKALDVLDGQRPSLETENPFALLASVQDAAFFMATADFAALSSNAKPKAQLFKNAAAAAMGIGESNQRMFGTLVLETGEPQAAKGMKMIADGLIALALLNAENDPNAAQLAEAAQVNAEGNRLVIQLSCSSDEFIAMVEEAEAKKKAK